MTPEPMFAIVRPSGRVDPIKMIDRLLPAGAGHIFVYDGRIAGNKPRQVSEDRAHAEISQTSRLASLDQGDRLVLEK